MRNIRAAVRVLVLVPFALASACDKPAPAVVADAAPATPAATSAAAAAAPSASAADKPTGKTVETPAGAASEVGTEIHLAGKPLYPPADCAAGSKDGCTKLKAVRAKSDGIKLLRHFDGPGGARSILLLQATSSSGACRGGPLFFVRLAASSPPQYSDVLDHCGGADGPDPMVGAMADKILISFPEHKASGGGTIAAKSMEYDIASGKLHAAEPSKKKKKH